MTRVKVRGFQIFQDRKGVWRCYHRATRTPVNLKDAPLGSAAFFAECVRITEKSKPVASKPGTLGGLIAAYRRSPRYCDLAELTRRDYDKVFFFLRPLHDQPVSRFTSPFVAKLRDRTYNSRRRRFANYVLAVLSLLFEWGIEQGLTRSNPATPVSKIKRPKESPDPNRPWSDDERHAVLDAAPPHLKVALALMMFTALGPKDALSLPRNFYKDGEIATRRSKTGHPVFFPAPAELQDVLDSAPPHDAVTLCVSCRGRPWTLSGFNSSWQAFRRKLQAEGKVGPGITPYGLRHTVAVILRESGHDERTIANALGQSSVEMARHYAKGADLRPKMRCVVASLDIELNRRRTKVVKPDG
jgi:integrase